MPASSEGRAKVHPHARGEHNSARNQVYKNLGSSPRPWGTHEPTFTLRAQDRFIPTPVGNTIASCHRSLENAVHPHARGEHHAPPGFHALPGGSSPRPWGTLTRRGSSTPLGRFIPTPVGNTFRESYGMDEEAVHPHARGEHFRTKVKACAATGSSPRPWGTREMEEAYQLDARFIPTPVGNTSSCSKRKSAKCGSSPRPWGTLFFCLHDGVLRRFIPTPVGNTRTR